jgi:hypothetical protein
LALACLLCVVASPVLAHNGAEDVSTVYLSGSSQPDGVATVHVDVDDTSVCDRLKPLRLEGVRAELDVEGTFSQVEPCHYEGEIDLPEPGRWAVTARFAYDNREAEVMMPVGVADAPQEFERDDWLHAVGGSDPIWSRIPTPVLALAGLLFGGLLTVGYRWWRGPRGTAPATGGGESV